MTRDATMFVRDSKPRYVVLTNSASAAYQGPEAFFTDELRVALCLVARYARYRSVGLDLEVFKRERTAYVPMVGA